MKVILIKEASKLQVIQGYLWIHHKDIETKIYLKEISMIMIESVRSNISLPLLVACLKLGIEMVFCDEKHQPTGTLHSFNYHSTGHTRLNYQMAWSKEIKDIVWGYIIQLKINTEITLLEHLNIRIDEILYEYALDVKPGDTSNREGLASKAYFKSIFGSLFKRHKEDVINGYLNYGYTILLSMFNRTIVSYGYLTQLGIHHHSDSNPFNFASDLMEPFRFVIDYIVYCFKEDNIVKRLRQLSSYKLKYNGKTMELNDVINSYVLNILNRLNQVKMEDVKIGVINDDKNISDV